MLTECTNLIILVIYCAAVLFSGMISFEIITEWITPGLHDEVIQEENIHPSPIKNSFAFMAFFLIWTLSEQMPLRYIFIGVLLGALAVLGIIAAVYAKN